MTKCIRCLKDIEDYKQRRSIYCKDCATKLTYDKRYIRTILNNFKNRVLKEKKQSDEVGE